MLQIDVSELSKNYKHIEKKEGFVGSINSLFNRKFKVITALNNVSFSIQQGELVGYIGPNGAGKSTTIKIMSGILVPDSGSCKIGDYIPWKDRKKYVSEIGVVFGQRTQLWWDIPVQESFSLLKDIYKIPVETYKKMKTEVIERLDIGSVLKLPVRQLSLGLKMRCELAASLLHNPKILFLDEPTIGLDAISKLAVRDFIKEINQEYKATVVLTTHDMDDIEALCNRVIIIGKGKILFDGDMSNLRRLVGKERRLKLDIKGSYFDKSLGNTEIIRVDGNRIIYSFNPEDISASELIKQASTKFEIADVFVENASIEEIISDLYEVLQL
ncbi:MAG: ATP-binding cassette domain-containing protein [Candidatus Delongbacteria bacterium]|nr:ATP-binding cassette domain-containing protein [Candidatus Delongbacteria bacterium]MBN2836916.1 ATP-binding cassette domain-containing protein [Candidatus Delongbacteria bacterium]